MKKTLVPGKMFILECVIATAKLKAAPAIAMIVRFGKMARKFIEGITTALTRTGKSCAASLCSFSQLVMRSVMKAHERVR